MLKTAKRLFSVLLTAVMVLTAVPLNGFVISATASENDTAGFSDGDIVTFGSYPNTLETNEYITDMLEKAVDYWVEYMYFSGEGTSETDYSAYNNTNTINMKYADVFLPGTNEKYRGVKINEYRPKGSAMASSEKNSYQDDNGFFIGNTYWFKYEPVKWRVLDADNRVLISEEILDSQPMNELVYYEYSLYGASKFYGYGTNWANNYQYSSLKDWLEEDFKIYAFLGDNVYDNVTDINIPYSETSYYFKNYEQKDFCAAGTDYAKSQGLFVDSNGYSPWRLQSSSNYDALYSIHNKTISSNGYCSGQPFANNTRYGIRPVITLDSFNCVKPFKDDGMRIIVNNTGLTYDVNDEIFIAVSNFTDSKENYIEHLSFKVTDSDVITVERVYDYADLPAELQKYSELKKCRFLYIKGHTSGGASVSIINNDTGETRLVPLNIVKSTKNQIRLNELKPTLYKNALESGDEYYFYNNKMYVADLEYKETSEGWNVSMNVYNENYCAGVIEVYDADGKLYDVAEIDKFESLSTGIIESAYAFGIVIDDFVDGNSCSFRSRATAKETSIKNLIIPQDGFIRITADSSISFPCAVINGFDIVFTACLLAKDVYDFITGIKEFSEEMYYSSKKELLRVLRESLKSELKKSYGDKFLKKFAEKGFGDVTPTAINDFASEMTYDCEQYLNDIGFSFDSLFKVSIGAGVGIADGVIEKKLGCFGALLNGMFFVLKLDDYLDEAHDIGSNRTGKLPTEIHSPIKGTQSGQLKKNNVIIDTDGKVFANTILETYKIVNNIREIDVGNGDLINEYELYEIALINNGMKIQPEGKVTVSVVLPYEDALVYKQQEDGSWVLIKSETKNGMIVFETDHFCRFIFTPKESSGEKLTVSIDDITVLSGASKKIVPKVISGGNASCSIDWESSDTNIAAVDGSGNVYGVSEGRATITCTVTDEYGNKAADTCTVTVKENSSTEIDFSSLKVGDTVAFGSYPQSEVTDSSIVSALNSISTTWISYNYYSGDNSYGSMEQSDYMKYADVMYNGEKYRGVTFSEYRPRNTYRKGDASYSNQSGNGYKTDNTYWFKFEPIQWIVIDPETGFVVSRDAIDSQSFCDTIYSYAGDYFGDSSYEHKANEYQFSTIRQWLNDSFYNSAFDEPEKELINVMAVDGTISDKVFLLSKSEAERNFSSNDSRRAKCTQYSECQGIEVTSGKADWLLRTPGSTDYIINSVDYNGTVWTGSDYTYQTSLGIRPAMYLKISDNTQNSKVYSVSIKTNYLFKYKDSFKLNPDITVSPDVKYTVTYESSDPGVVTVDKDGNAYFSGRGTAEVTCNVTDEYGNTVKDIRTLTVKFSFFQWLIWIFLLGFLWY